MYICIYTSHTRFKVLTQGFRLAGSRVNAGCWVCLGVEKEGLHGVRRCKASLGWQEICPANPSLYTLSFGLVYSRRGCRDL